MYHGVHSLGLVPVIGGYDGWPLGIKLLLNWFVIVCYRLVSFVLAPRPAQCLIICMGRGHVVQGTV